MMRECLKYIENNTYRIEYYDKSGKLKVIHGFKTPKEARNYLPKLSEDMDDDYPLILNDSDYCV